MKNAGAVRIPQNSEGCRGGRNRELKRGEALLPKLVPVVADHTELASIEEDDPSPPPKLPPPLLYLARASQRQM